MSFSLQRFAAASLCTGLPPKICGATVAAASTAAVNPRKLIPATKRQPAHLADDAVFEKVETEAVVDTSLWRRHLATVLLPFLESKAEDIPPGNYPANVRFAVEADGRISGAVILSDSGYGLAEAAVAAARQGPRGRPGTRGGANVRSYHTQPITFVVDASDERPSGTAGPPAPPARQADCGDSTKLPAFAF